MKTWIVILAAASAATGLASAAIAAPTAPTFTVTDLGNSFQLLTDSSGHAHAVANSDGSQTYDFDKSPVTAISEKIEAWPSVHAGGYFMYTLQNGDLKRGYTFDRASVGTLGSYNAPTTVGFLNGWHTYPPESPLADMNSSGQIVGTSLPVWEGHRYAAFSDAVGNSHGWGAWIADNLNNYIGSGLKIDLTAGLKVDDLGRIIAEGTLEDGSVHDFLLTPPGLLSSPSTVPEPTALATLTFAAAGTLARRSRQRRRSWMSDAH